MAEQSIKKNYIYNVLFQIFSLIVPFITMPYVSRVLQTDGIGYYSYTNSIVTYFTLFAALGIGAYGAREVSMERRDKGHCSVIFWELTTLRAITTALFFTAYIVCVYVNNVNIPIYLAASFAILSVAFDFTWYLQALEDFKALILRNFVIKLLSVVCVFIFVKKEGDLPLYILIQTGGTFVANIFTIPLLKKYLIKVNFHKLQPFSHLRQTLIYFVPAIASSVYTVLDKTMIGVMTRSNFENGYYEQGHKIINIMLTVITSLNVIVGMRTSYLFGQGKDEEIREYIKKTFRFMSMVSMPLMFGLVATARNFVPVFFGEGYDKVAPVMMLFSPIVFIIGTSNIIGTLYLTPSGQRARSNRIIIIGAAVNFVLNLILIPVIKSYGAVIASLAAEGIIALLYIKICSQYISMWDIFRSAIKYTMFSAVMLLVVHPIGIRWHGITALIVQVSVGVAIYAALLLISHDEIIYEEVRKIFKIKDEKKTNAVSEEVTEAPKPSESLKNIWAVEKDLLIKFISVCDKNGIRYFVSGGTLLGTVRHKGFIPWDDDVDIAMLREDYDRLLKIAPQEFQEPYFYQSFDTDCGYYRGHAQLRNSNTTGMLPHECNKVKFNQGIFIDIFPLDAVPDDIKLASKQRRRLGLYNRLLGIGARMNEPSGNRFAYMAKRAVGKVISIFYPYRRQYEAMERECRRYNGTNTQKVAHISFDPNNTRMYWNRYAYEDVVQLEFDGISVSAPSGWDEVLRHQYGDYMVMRMEKNCHGAVIFDTEKSYREYLKK